MTATAVTSGQMRLVRDNLARVRERIETACHAAGRSVDGVRLIGVTKSVTPALARALVEAGCGDLAEGRPQALWSKQESLADLGDRVRWHLIGHLQRNKVRRTLPLCHLVHSLDSRRLLAALATEAQDLGRAVDVLIEVNLAGSEERTGLAPGEVRPLLDAWPGPWIRLRGLMGMASAPDAGAPPAARRQFATLRELRDRLREERPGLGLEELSMGMSDDFEDAILEGATLVRIGSALWEGVAMAEGQERALPDRDGASSP